MYTRFLLGLGLAVWISGALNARAQFDDPRIDLVLEELHHLRESIDALTKEIKELRERPAPTPAPRPVAVREDMRGPDRDALAEIQFPADPTPDALRAYIREINRLTEGQRSYSNNDPQVDMLMRVGPDQLALLLESMGGRHTHGLGGHYHAREAVIRLADEPHKNLILEHLPQNKELARVIVRFGWEEDAKETLLDGIAGVPDYLPGDWIQAVANLDAPESHPFLLAFLMHGRNRSQTYRIISSQIAEGLDEAVEEAWHQSREEWERKQMAPIAAQHGLRDALDYMIREMADLSPSDDWSTREWRPTIIRVTGFRGSTPELIRWYEEHKDRLEYDPEQRRYVLSD